MKTKTKNRKITVFILAALVIIASGIIVTGATASEDSKTREGRIQASGVQNFSQSARFLSRHDAKNWESEYLSPKISADFTFNGVGANWQGKIPGGSSVDIYIRTCDKVWSSWAELPQPEDGALLQKGEQHYTDPLFFIGGKKLQYKVIIKPNKDYVWPEIENLEIIYLNTEKGRTWGKSSFLKYLVSKEAKAEDGLKIISREEWGADESYRLDSNGEALWPPAYEKVQKFVIHHTAGSNGKDNPAASVRGIYYWHAIVRGWGDIGYNFLIDSQGNIYEGRYGGDGVIGAHVFNEIKNINYNEGSIGIAVMGCYDTSEDSYSNPACSKTNTVNKNIQTSLADLIAEKALLHEIPPQGNGIFIDENIPNIVGHSDLDATLCPGDRIKDKLEPVRVAAQKGFLDQGGDKMKYASQFVSHNIVPAAFLSDHINAEVIFKNSGTENWDKDKMTLKTYDLNEKISQYKDSSWEDEYGSFQFKEEKVGSDNEATFKFSLSTPKSPGLYKQIYRLYYDGQEIAGGRFTLTTRADSLYRAELKSHNIPLAMLNVWRMPIIAKFKNTGVATWDRDLVLSSYDLGMRPSVFYDPTWDYSVGRFELLEKEVAPGEVGTFKFYLDAPLQPGLYMNVLQLEIPGRDDVVVQNGQIPMVTRIDGLSKK